MLRKPAACLTLLIESINKHDTSLFTFSPVFHVVSSPPSANTSVAISFLKSLRSVPLGYLLFEPKYRELFTKSDSCRVLDIGCGTSTASAHFLRSSLRLACLIEEQQTSNAHELWLLDKNRSWLGLLEDEVFAELGEDATPILYVHGDLTDLANARIVNSVFPVPEQPWKYSEIESSSLFEKAKFATLLLHSDMLGWFPFFETDTHTVAKSMARLTDDNGILVLTRLKRQPARSVEPLIEQWAPFNMMQIKENHTDNQTDAMPFSIELLGNSPSTLARSIGVRCNEKASKTPSEEQMIQAFQATQIDGFQALFMVPR